MAVTYEKLLQSIKDKKFEPVYLLHGPEPYFIDKISDYIENNALNESERSFNQVILYGRDIDATTLLGACTRYPMMAQYQVVIVKEAQNLKGLEQLEKYFEKPVPSTILVLCHKYKSIDKRLKVSKILEKSAVVFESKPLQDAKLPDWIKNYVKENALQIADRAAYLLAEFVGSDLEKLANALDKIILALDKGATITEKDIETHVGISRQYNAFELTSALANRDITKITKLVNFFSGSGKKEFPLPVIIGTLYSYFSKTTALFLTGKQDKETLKELGINEWFSKDFVAGAKSFGGSLPYIMQLLEQYDLRFKGVNDTGTNDSELLKELIFKIAYIR